MSRDRRSRSQPSSIAGHRRRNRIAGQFVALLVDMLESPAWCVLSLSGRRVLDRVMIELRHHGGHEGDGLCVTHADFCKYGIHDHAVAPAIREAVALGLLRITRQGRAGNSEFRRATLFKLTFVNTVDGEPTHDWKRIKSLDEAELKARSARAGRRKKTELHRRKPPAGSPAESASENGELPLAESASTAPAESASTSDISRRRRRRPSLRQEGAAQRNAAEGRERRRNGHAHHEPNTTEPAQ